MGKKQKIRKRNPDAFELFCFATAYWKAAAAVARGLAVAYPYTMPLFVIEAFSLELHFKCLHRVRRKLLDLTHEPKELHARLSVRDKKLIVRYAKDSPKRGDIDMESVLMRCDGVFQKLRYMHEGHDWPRDKSGAGGNGGFNLVVRALHRIILEKHPDWDARKNAALGI